MSSFSFLFWEPLVLPISTWVCGHPLGFKQPTSSHVPRGEWLFLHPSAAVICCSSNRGGLSLWVVSAVTLSCLEAFCSSSPCPLALSLPSSHEVLSLGCRAVDTNDPRLLSAQLYSAFWSEMVYISHPCKEKILWPKLRAAQICGCKQIFKRWFNSMAI